VKGAHARGAQSAVRVESRSGRDAVSGGGCFRKSWNTVSRAGLANEVSMLVWQ